MSLSVSGSLFYIYINKKSRKPLRILRVNTNTNKIDYSGQKWCVFGGGGGDMRARDEI